MAEPDRVRLAPSPRSELRERIVAVAADLLAEGGRDAVTTRAVAVAADVQAPTIYRLFGDKNGLLEAVAEHGFAAYLARKQRPDVGSDPVVALREGWQLHVGFGLANPALYFLMYGDPHPGGLSPAAATGHAVLRSHIHRLAQAGVLRVSEDLAANLVHASGSGTVLALLSTPEDQRDPALRTLALDAVIAAITGPVVAGPDSTPASAAITLRAVLDGGSPVLTDAEHSLLSEWLDRLIRFGAAPAETLHRFDQSAPDAEGADR